MSPSQGGCMFPRSLITFLDFIPCSPLLKPLVPKNDFSSCSLDPQNYCAVPLIPRNFYPCSPYLFTCFTFLFIVKEIAFEPPLSSPCNPFMLKFIDRHFCLKSWKAWFSYAIDTPATWPPVVPGILFRYENRSGRQHWSSQYLLPTYLRSWLEFNFVGMPAVKLCDGSSCRRRMFSFVREVVQAVPAATSHVHRRYMRTRLNAKRRRQRRRTVKQPETARNFFMEEMSYAFSLTFFFYCRSFQVGFATRIKPFAYFPWI